MAMIFQHLAMLLQHWKAAQKHYNLAKVGSKFFPNTEKALNHLTKIKKMLSKWQNFAKSGHTEYNTRLFC